MSNSSVKEPYLISRNDVEKSPYDAFKKMRKNFPVCEIDENLWAVSCYDDVEFVLKNHQIFSSTAYNDMYHADWLSSDIQTERFVLAQDPPEHTRYRKIINKAFVGRVINKLIPLMNTTAKSLLNQFDNHNTVNFVDAFSYPYIGKVIGTIMGTESTQNIDEFREWIALEEKVSPIRPDDDYIEAFEAATRRQYNHFQTVADSRRKHPKNDLVSILIHTEIDGSPMSNNMFLSAMVVLCSAGYHTTIQMLNNAIIQLSESPDLFNLLKNNFKYISPFIEELLRRKPVVKTVLRKTMSSVDIRGVTIPKSAFVLPFIASANHDSSVFFDPDNFILNRDNAKKHLSFGVGVHTCIGEALARLELKIALENILTEFSEFSALPGYILEDTMFTQSVKALNIKCKR